MVAFAAVTAPAFAASAYATLLTRDPIAAANKTKASADLQKAQISSVPTEASVLATDASALQTGTRESFARCARPASLCASS